MEVHWKIELNVLLLVFGLWIGATAQIDREQLDSLAHDLKWGALDSAGGLYFSTYPDSSWGYYYKAKALHGLLLHDSALHYLDAFAGKQEPEYFLLFEVERGGVWNSKNRLDVADSVFRSCEARYLPNGFPNFTAAYQLYDRWAENRWFAGKPFESEELLRKGLPFIAPDDNRLIARVNNNLGIVNWQLGRFVEALNYFQDAERAYRKAYGDEDSRVAKALNNQGVVYLDMADNKRAQRHFDAALEILKHAETDVNNTYFAYSNLSIIALEEERWNQALDLSQQALDLLSRGQGNAIARMMEPLEVQAAVWRGL
ncbi:MAG: tetratricopeptide repeat protein, partial [Flavobacteriales bacterium]|nr:tetratricopeptide repeat protein [Flavobacteriales bacterium]